MSFMAFSVVVQSRYKFILSR